MFLQNNTNNTNNSNVSDDSDNNTSNNNTTSTPGKVGTDGVDNWDSEVYNMLTPEQKTIYENLSSDSRASMNKNIRNVAKREEEGWTTQWDQSESFGDQWSQVTVNP